MISRRPVRYTVTRMFGRPVETWVTTLWPDASDEPLPEMQLLTAEERAYRAEIPWREQRAQFTVGRALLRRVLGRRLGVPPSRVPLCKDAQGRPRVCAGTDYDFNLSHSDSRVTLVVARGLRVGVDIERLAARSSAPRISQRYFNDREKSLLERTSDAAYLDRWYRIWTTREAHAKAHGSGISGISHPMDGHRTDWLRRSLYIGEGYTGTVVALHPHQFPLTKELKHAC